MSGTTSAAQAAPECRSQTALTRCPLAIVVADDEPDMLDYYHRILPRLGHQVVGAARDGQELVNTCLRLHPDLVITDLRMPVLNGDVAIRRIWEHQRVPVILVSAYQFPTWLGDGIDTELLRYIEKPIKRNELESTITQLLDAHRANGHGTDVS